MKTVYIETTIPSFYHETRLAPEMVARRRWTRRWWDQRARRFRLVTSDGVIAELLEGDYPAKAEIVRLISDLPRVEVVDEIAAIIDAYIANQLMPRERLGDALHLALASYHRCDFLLTWNCSHIANANKFEHIRVINSRLGLSVPALVTPMELLGEESP